jgi:hypothetical protein
VPIDLVRYDKREAASRKGQSRAQRVSMLLGLSAQLDNLGRQPVASGAPGDVSAAPRLLFGGAPLTSAVCSTLHVQARAPWRASGDR